MKYLAQFLLIFWCSILEGNAQYNNELARFYAIKRATSGVPAEVSCYVAIRNTGTNLLQWHINTNGGLVSFTNWTGRALKIVDAKILTNQYLMLIEHFPTNPAYKGFFLPITIPGANSTRTNTLRVYDPYTKTTKTNSGLFRVGRVIYTGR